MTLLRTLTLMGATLTMGLVAGAFALYAHSIMPGLRKTDDRTFVAAFQQLDRAIINPWFMITAFRVEPRPRRHQRPGLRPARLGPGALRPGQPVMRPSPPCPPAGPGHRW